MLRHLHDSSLASQVRRRRHPVAGKGRDAGGENDLALDGWDLAALIVGLTETSVERILVTSVEQLEESGHGEKSSRYVDAQHIVHVFHVEVVKQVLFRLRNGMLRVETDRRTNDARIGDDKVDIADISSDLVNGFLEISLGGDVGLEWDYGRVLFGCCLEDFQTSAQDIDLLGTIVGEGPGHGQTNA